MSNDDSQNQAADTETDTPATEEASEPTDAKEASEANAEGGSDGESAAPPEAEPAEPPLEQQLEQSRAATAKMKEKMLRVAADFENYRRRAAREVEDARKGGTQSAVKDLLPVFDNLERATGHVDDKTDVEGLVKGLEIVHKQFLDVIGKLGIERIAAVGESFDPNVHESIQYEHSEEHPPGTVMSELQPGYRMGTMLLRPSLVVVSRGPTPKEEPAEPAPDDAEAKGHSSDEETGETTPGGAGTEGGAEDAGSND